MSIWTKIFGGGRDERSSTALLRLRSQFVGTPLAFEPSKVETFLASLADAKLPDTAAKSAIDGPTSTAAAATGPVVRRIPVHGVLVQRSMGELLDWWFGVTGYDALRSAIANAVLDPNVKEIVLDVDSPGGSVAGLHALTDVIASARQTKPITAIIDELAASAAYQIAAACTRIVAPETALVGSIGVISTHVDWSAWNEKAGLKVTHIHAGAHKADLSPDHPLSPDALAEQQARIDQFYELFIGAVARYRSLDPKVLRDTEARIVMAAEAKALGLIDEVAPVAKAFEDVVARLDEEPGDDPVPAAPNPGDDEPSARGALPMAQGGIVKPPSLVSVMNVDVEQVIAAERERAAETLAICAAFGGRDPFALARKLVVKGASIDEVRSVAAAEAVAADPQTINAAVDPASIGTDRARLFAEAMREHDAQRNNR